MTTHARKQIRDAVVTLLKAGVPGVSNRVYSNRATSFKPEQLPAINVITTDETASEQSSSTRESKRILALEIEILVADANAENVDDVADALALLVESVLAANETLNGKANDTKPKATSVDLRSAGAQAMAGLRLVYDVEYFTIFVPLESSLPAFAKGQYVLRPADATDDTPAMSGLVEPEQPA